MVSLCYYRTNNCITSLFRRPAYATHTFKVPKAKELVEIKPIYCMFSKAAQAQNSVYVAQPFKSLAEYNSIVIRGTNATKHQINNELTNRRPNI